MPIGHTLTLDLNEWDFMLDSGGNIATSVGLYPWYGADTATDFPGLNYLVSWHVLGSGGSEHVARKPSEPDVPSQEEAALSGRLTRCRFFNKPYPCPFRFVSPRFQYPAILFPCSRRICGGSELKLCWFPAVMGTECKALLCMDG